MIGPGLVDLGAVDCLKEQTCDQGAECPRGRRQTDRTHLPTQVDYKSEIMTASLFPSASQVLTSFHPPCSDSTDSLDDLSITKQLGSTHQMIEMIPGWQWLASCILLYLATLVVYRLKFHHAAHIPGPFLAKVTFCYGWYYDLYLGG